MLRSYETFYRSCGIRKASQFTTPPLIKLALLDLPTNAVYHATSVSPVDVGPAVDDFIFRNIHRPIMMLHVSDLGDNKGHPRRLNVAPEPMIRKYHNKNRRFKLLRDIASTAKDPNSLVVYNYGTIPHLYQYMRSFYSEYFKWWNATAAVWDNIGKVAQASNRQQFVICKLPTVLPSISDLNNAYNVTQKTVEKFNSPEKLMLLELWKLLGPEPSTSVISKANGQLDKVNIIFQEAGCWFVVNLGKVLSWRKSTSEEAKIAKENNTTDSLITKGIACEALQRGFLHMVMALFQVRTVGAVGTEPILMKPAKADEKALADKVSSEVTVVNQPAAIPVVNKATGAIDTPAQTTTTSTVLSVDGIDHAEGVDDTAATATLDENFSKQMEADLAELERITNLSANATDTTPAKEPDIEVVNETPKTLEHGVSAMCDVLADKGLLSAAEYRRYNALATSYKTLPSPYGKETLEEFLKIDPQVLKIEAPEEFKDKPTVLDKTMLKSSLGKFDEHYVKHVMKKDVANMVMGVQNAGIAVTDYTVEPIEDIMGSYESHTVRVTPVDGATSTLRFTLPKVNEDGVYVANGIRYRLRKQRFDLPIRKVGPDSVALSSYYGKTFVRRSTKRVNDYGQWLSNNIMAKGLDNEDTVISDLKPSPCFDSEFVCPRLYSTLAMNFRSFILTPRGYPRFTGPLSFEVNFDHTKRLGLFGKEALAEYEKKGVIIVGKSDKEYLLLLDTNNVFYIVGKDGVLHPYGTIESLLELTEEHPPVEFIELRVMGKSIPVGVVLGYELGLEKLMKLLKAEPRRVAAGQRVGLQTDEYSLVFSDETLVFSRDDKLASTILAGFNEYHRAIRSYSVYEFDKRGVYLNILEAGNQGTRFLREVDLMYQMFVDPITREILVEMKEPTDFRGLLLRACEMLQNDQHPDELDSSQMRYKGYERMAGAVYSEMVKTIRAHNGRPGKSKLQLDLNPYAVWKNIATDPSISLVSDINPVQNLKEIEAVTTGGTGGRSSRSMTKHTRTYHRNDMGVISEATVDSSDVGINTYTSADPQFTSLRGLTKPYVVGETGATALLSTSALLAPGADTDDPKRVNIIELM